MITELKEQLKMIQQKRKYLDDNEESISRHVGVNIFNHRCEELYEIEGKIKMAIIEAEFEEAYAKEHSKTN